MNQPIDGATFAAAQVDLREQRRLQQQEEAKKVSDQLIQNWKLLTEAMNKLENVYMFQENTGSWNSNHQIARPGTEAKICKSNTRESSAFKVQVGYDRDQQSNGKLWFGSKPIDQLATHLHSKVQDLLYKEHKKHAYATEKANREKTVESMIRSSFDNVVSIEEDMYRSHKGEYKSSGNKVVKLSNNVFLLTPDGANYTMKGIGLYPLVKIKEIMQFIMIDQDNSPFDELIVAAGPLALVSNSSFIRGRAEKLLKDKKEESNV